MASPVTKTDIVNAAAALVGSSERITSMDGAGNLASHARAFWDSMARRLLADHPWNFAIKRAALNAGPAPAFGYTYSYALPADCLRFLSAEDADGSEIETLCEGGLLLTDSETANVRYISSEFLDSTSRWPAHLVTAAEHALAMLLAEGLTGAQGIANSQAEAADEALRRARRIDGLESQDRRLRNVNVRSNFLWASHPNYPWNR